MVPQVSREERELIDLINKIPTTDKKKETWEETIRENGIDKEFLDIIHKEILTLQKKKDLNWNGTLISTELARIVKRWRLSQQTRTFSKRRF